MKGVPGTGNSSPDDVGMTMLLAGAELLYLYSTSLLQGELEVNVLSHLDLLVKQGGLALAGQAAAGVLQAAHDACRSLQGPTYLQGPLWWSQDWQDMNKCEPGRQLCYMNVTA